MTGDHSSSIPTITCRMLPVLSGCCFLISPVLQLSCLYCSGGNSLTFIGVLSSTKDSGHKFTLSSSWVLYHETQSVKSIKGKESYFKRLENTKYFIIYQSFYSVCFLMKWEESPFIKFKDGLYSDVKRTYTMTHWRTFFECVRTLLIIKSIYYTLTTNNTPPLFYGCPLVWWTSA